MLLYLINSFAAYTLSENHAAIESSNTSPSPIKQPSYVISRPHYFHFGPTPKLSCCSVLDLAFSPLFLNQLQCFLKENSIGVFWQEHAELCQGRAQSRPFDRMSQLS